MEANLSPSKKRKQLVLDLVATLIVLLLALLVVLPIWWIFRSSLMSTAKLNEYPPSFIPHEWLWANYSKALETFEYWRYFRNTFSIIIPAVTFGTVTAIFCGYAFARLRLLIIKQSYFITFIRNNQAFFCKFTKKFLYKKICSSVFFNR